MRMRAACLVERGRMVCEMAATREPAQGEVLVRTQYASICGSDLHKIMLGIDLPPFPQLPGFPGHEGVGEVVESRDPRFRPGDRVLTVPAPPQSFTFADYQTLSGAFCLQLPERGNPLHLLMAQQLGTVIFAFRRNPTDLVGKTVMVMGQGSAGLFFAYLLKKAGAAQVIVSDLSEARLALSRGMGADVCLLAHPKNVREAVLDLTGGRGVDYLVEAVGSRDALLESVHLVRPDGEMLLFGLPDTHEPIPFHFYEFFRKRIRAAATYGAQWESGLTSFREAADLITRGDINIEPLLSHLLSIEQIDHAMRLAHERFDGAIKVSIRMQ
jgi:L-iditol 2-dehydrogenase